MRSAALIVVVAVLGCGDNLSTARARFTDDSRRLLYGGDTWPQSCRLLHQLDLATGEVGEVGCYVTRFEADDASAWVAVVATKPFDVAPDSQALAFVGEPSSGTSAGIWTVPISGGTPARLGDGVDLVGFVRDAVAYRGAWRSAAPTYAVAPSGGARVSRWSSTIIDVEAGLLLARTAGAMPQVLPLPPVGPSDVVPTVDHAVIIDATRLVVHAARTLRRGDLDAAGHVIDDVVRRADIKKLRRARWLVRRGGRRGRTRRRARHRRERGVIVHWARWRRDADAILGRAMIALGAA